MSTFYVVATPIGNLHDMSERALNTLRSVDVVLCEDTRVTRKLLQHFDIQVSTRSYHAHTSEREHERIVRELEAGTSYALVTDAGTPAVSDPGARLVALVADRLGDSVSIVPLPGPSAVIALLSVAGLVGSEYCFLGFLPQKKGRIARFKKLAESSVTTVFYESPHRALKTLEALAAHLAPAQRVVVGRELTKLHEEVRRGSATELLEHYQEHSEKLKGEWVFAVGMPFSDKTR